MMYEVRQEGGDVDYDLSGVSYLIDIYDYYAGLRTWDSEAWYLGVF